VVLGERGVSKEVKIPTPPPSKVLVERATVGEGLKDQTRPLPVIVAPPSKLILPPLRAVVPVILLIEVVDRLGT
jgi:hypothetical protein